MKERFRLLHEVLRSVLHTANSGGHSPVIRKMGEEDREIRFTFPRPAPAGMLQGDLAVEERHLTDGVWTEWVAFRGFDVEDVHVWYGPPGPWPLWEEVEGCGQPCGSVRGSPGIQFCQDRAKKAK